MNRTIAFAALAAALIAGPVSAQSIHISTAGKTSDQVKTEVFKAAQTLCWAEMNGPLLQIQSYRACVTDTVKAALAQSADLAAATPTY